MSPRPASAGVAAAALEDGITATAWAADHAGELGADPRRLAVAGEGRGAGVAAAVALQARDAGWPALTRQVLIRPDMGAAPIPGPSVGPDPLALPFDEHPLAGVAPATVIVAGDDDLPLDGGRRYAARLRHAGVEVEVLRDDGARHGDVAAPAGRADDRMIGELARSLRHVLGAPPTGQGPRGEVPT